MKTRTICVNPVSRHILRLTQVDRSTLSAFPVPRFPEQSRAMAESARGKLEAEVEEALRENEVVTTAIVLDLIEKKRQLYERFEQDSKVPTRS